MFERTGTPGSQSSHHAGLGLTCTFQLSAAVGKTGGKADGGEGEEKEATSWVEFFGSEPLKHPYMYILFLGQDGRGDYVPCR